MSTLYIVTLLVSIICTKSPSENIVTQTNHQTNQPLWHLLYTSSSFVNSAKSTQVPAWYVGRNDFYIQATVPFMIHQPLASAHCKTLQGLLFHTYKWNQLLIKPRVFNFELIILPPIHPHSNNPHYLLTDKAPFPKKLVKLDRYGIFLLNKTERMGWNE